MSVCLIVFGRAPTVGAVKTRLIPALGAEAATRLHVVLFEHALRAALGTGLPMRVALDGPAPAVPLAAELRAAGVTITGQSGDDLGERMHRAMQAEHDRGHAPLLMGTDCPGIDTAYIRRAAADLAACRPRLVVGPAQDGGYGLIGLNCPAGIELPRALFSGIPWGTNLVRPLTLSRAHELGLDVCSQPSIWDVDWPQDVQRLARDYPQLAAAAGIDTVAGSA